MVMTKTYRNIEYTYTISETWNGIKYDNYHCNDRNLLDGLDTVSFTKLSEQDMRDEIDQLIDKKWRNILLQDLIHEARRDWYTNTYSGEYTGD